jgi:hypothetical protein
VPIELKLVDMSWSGPQLCERLRNQLAGDYLREAKAGCGIMLLMWRGSKPGRRWEIDGQSVALENLPCALAMHWAGVSSNFPNVSAITVVGIDLTSRSIKSTT